jgi:uncharacterized protein (DUF736 family)
MTTIGTFTSEGERFTGYIRTLTLNSGVAIVPAPKASEKAPDYRVLSGATEIGAAWKKTSAEGNAYLSIRLDDPSFNAPIACRLVAAEDEHRLIWSR